MSLQVTVNLKEYNVDDLKRIVALQHREIMAKNDQLKGVKDLTEICHDLEEKRDSWQAKAVNYENALRRAEARIAYLNKKLGIGPQTAFNIDVVNPGISRRDFEALTRENIRLKEALDHIVNAELGGQDVVLKNRELFELVTTLQEDLARCDHHIKELEKTLASKGDDLATRVNELTKLTLKYERSLKAKQVFSENLLKENKKLKDLLEKHEIVDVVNLQTLDVGEDLPDGHFGNNAQQVNKDRTVPSQSDVSNEEHEKLKAMIEVKEKINLEYASKDQETREEIEKLNKNIAELTSELEKANKVVKKAQTELNETTKKRTDFQKKCAGFFKQAVSLNAKQQESENEISSLKRSNDNLRADVEDKKAMLTMMTDSLKNYEEDFRRESEDEGNFEKKWRTSQQESERLKRENQSHMATIRHFESEIERMNKLLNDERSRKNEGGFHHDDVEKKCKTPQQESDAMHGRNTSHVERAKSLSENEGGFHDDDVEKKCKTPRQESDAMHGRNTSHVERAKSLSEIEQKEKFANGDKNYCEVKFDSNKCGLTVNVNGPHAQVIFRDVKINEK